MCARFVTNNLQKYNSIKKGLNYSTLRTSLFRSAGSVILKVIVHPFGSTPAKKQKTCLRARRFGNIPKWNNRVLFRIHGFCFWNEQQSIPSILIPIPE